MLVCVPQLERVRKRDSDIKKRRNLTGYAALSTLYRLVPGKRLLAVLGQVGCHPCSGGLHRLVTLFPVGRTDVAMGVGKLEGIQHPQGLINTAAQRQIVDDTVPHHPFGVDQEEAAQGDHLIQQNPVIAADLFVEICHHRELDLADTTVFHLGIFPSQVGKLGVDRDGKQFAVALLELIQLLIKGQNLGRADKGKIQRVKQQVDVFALVAGQADLGERIVRHDNIGGEVGGGLGNQGATAHSVLLYGKMR